MIYVITAVHNRYNITKAFVKCLCEQTYKDIQLVLVDDGSTDGTADMVKRIMPKAIVIKGDGNLWWGGALHKAYLWMKENAEKNAYVMFANDDSSFLLDYIEREIKVLEKNRKTLVTGCGISRQTGEQVDGAVRFNVLEGKSAVQRGDGVQYGNCASTRSLFFRVEDLIKIGGFHPVLLPHYASDFEWTIRACTKYGYTVVCDPDIRYEVDTSTTGDNNYDKMTKKSIFSKRSVSNPIYKFNFILLTAPITKWFPAIWIQCKKYMKKKKEIMEIIKR